MKNTITCFVVLLSSFSAFALSPKGETAKKKVVETYAATKEYTIEQKEEFTTALKSELNDLDKDISSMKASAAKESDQARKDIDAQIVKLEAQRKDLGHQIDRLSTATSSAWTEIRTGVQSAFKEVKSSINRASEKYNQKK